MVDVGTALNEHLQRVGVDHAVQHAAQRLVHGHAALQQEADELHVGLHAAPGLRVSKHVMEQLRVGGELGARLGQGLVRSMR